MKKHIYVISLTFFSLLAGMFNLGESTSLQGKITDAESGEPILFGNVALYHNGKLLTGVETDFDGNYVFSNIDPGEYDVEVSYVGYQLKRISGVIVKSGKVTKLNIRISEGVVCEEVVIQAYKVPLIDLDFTSTGSTVTAEQIRSLPTKGINDIATTAAGITTIDGGDISVRGGRTNSTVYFIDGIRTSDRIPQSEIEEQSLGLTGSPVAPVTPSSAKRYLNEEKVTHKRYKDPRHQPVNREQYNPIVENPFISPQDEGLSTFSIDVDRASYSNVRRHLINGTLPPSDAVRIEEMINYFDYDYAGPDDDVPFAIHQSLVECPWAQGHQLMHIGLQGERVKTSDLPASNLVFLIDVSGSMNNYKKLPLVKASLKMLVNELRDEDRVAIVTYAGQAGVALPSTSIDEKGKIIQVIESLGAGGSTAGAEGIHTAYKIAQENFLKKGNNRVLLATDGDFNIGVSSQDGLEKLIEEKRKSGIFLSVLGFGMGNYQDGKMQTLANKGNGNHAYIDDIKEANKVLVKEFGGTLFTIAKDVKIQIEFNPAYVQNYRLIGYENRLLANEDFNDDTKDAGELGAGHTVTAIYEIIPVGVEPQFLAGVDPLKYQTVKRKPALNFEENGELATVKLRYKQPDGNRSKKIVEMSGPKANKWEDASPNVQLSIALAEFGQLLRNSQFKGTASYDHVLELLEDRSSQDIKDLKELVKAAQVAQ